MTRDPAEIEGASDEPLAPFMRAIKLFVIVAGIAILILGALLVYALRARGDRTDAPAPPAAVQLEPGQRVAAIDFVEGQTVVRLEDAAGGGAILTFEDGRLAHRIDLIAP